MAKTSKTADKKTVKKAKPKQVLKKLKPEDLKSVIGGDSTSKDSWIEC